MGTLLYFTVYAGLFFLMMRFGCGAHVMGHGHRHHDRQGAGPPRHLDSGLWVPPETAVDPVCGMTVRTGTAKSAVYKGKVYYFCSAEYRDAFEFAPDRYIGSRTGPAPTPMEHSHGWTAAKGCRPRHPASSLG
jgi:YHS domain-containing protein